MARRTTTALVLLALLLVAVALGHLCTGNTSGRLHWPDRADVAALRLNRLAIAGTVGASLALAGVLLQALLRNPLASPDLLGVTSGAGLGVATAAFVASEAGGSAHPAAQSVAALLGAGVTLGIILVWTHRRGGIDVVSLVLVGVIVGMTASGLTLLLHHLLPDRGMSARAWFFGSVNESASAGLVGGGALALALSLALGVRLAGQIDAACLGEDEARSVGVRLGRLRLVLFAASGVLATSAVLLAGPIGFVGLIVPHAVRMVLGPRHGPLLIGATLAGAAVVIAADGAVSAFPLSRGGRLPVGVLMAIVGGPCFLLLLRSTLRRSALA
jgi:iron complex transport system permease protein